MSKNSVQYQITRENVALAIPLCLESAELFALDAECLLASKRTRRALLPVTYSLEELGKAVILVQVLQRPGDPLEIVKADGFMNHETKIRQALPLMHIPEVIREELDQRIKENLEAEGLDLDSPDSQAEFEKHRQATEAKMRDYLGQLHWFRLNSCFVEFDRGSGRPKLGVPLTPGAMSSTVHALKEAIEAFRNSIPAT